MKKPNPSKAIAPPLPEVDTPDAKNKDRSDSKTQSVQDQEVSLSFMLDDEVDEDGEYSEEESDAVTDHRKSVKHKSADAARRALKRERAAKKKAEEEEEEEAEGGEA